MQAIARRPDDNKWQIKYKFSHVQRIDGHHIKNAVIFQGDDFFCPYRDPTSYKAALSLLGFLTLRPGDTDGEYFSKYTPEQLEFANSQDCENLQMYTEEQNV